MAETWLPFCIPELGPLAKRGYNGVATRRLDEIEGEVKHSMEGTLAGAVGRLMTPLTSDPYTQASWHFSVPKAGKPRQHYPLEAICWHAGLPGDRRFDTSLVGNLRLVGTEHEDHPDNKLNAEQIHWSTEISRAIRALCPRVGAQPPTRRVNLWEHRELSATSCPSGLIPWDTIISMLKAATEEDDMPFPPPHYHSNSEGAMMLIGLLKHPLDSAGHARAHALGSADIGPVDLSGLQYLASTFQQSFPADPGAGLTAEEIAAIAKAVRTEFETNPLK